MEIRIELKLDREAKNTVRYVEAARPFKLFNGVVYIAKAELGDDPPRELEMTVAPKVKLAAVG